MVHFGILCPAAIGHLNPMCAVGRELQRRGHQVTIFQVSDIKSKIEKTGLNFWTIGEVEFPPGTTELWHKKLGEMSGMPAFRFTIDCLKKEIAMFFKEAPDALQKAGVEALLVDQVTAAGGTIADYLNIPFVTVCNALLTDIEDGVPPYFTNWTHNPPLLGLLRNRLGNFLINRLTQGYWNVVVEQRRQWNLPPYILRQDAGSPLAQICQLPPEFDFPRVNLPQWFHYTGPLQDLSGSEPISPPCDFPFNKLTGQPLIYAALGTLQNRRTEIFECIASACVDLEMQLVISLGSPNQPQSSFSLPGSPIVVSFAPQQQLITKASLTITHAGMNTVLGSLSTGVPLVAIPITNEQPGIAARLARTGAGEVIPLKKLSVLKLRETIKKVREQESYKQNAIRMKEIIAHAGGVTHAADIIEKAVFTKKPVLAVQK